MLRPRLVARPAFTPAILLFATFAALTSTRAHAQSIGKEIAVPHHFADGEEFSSSLKAVLREGQLLFNANWTNQEGGGRPLTKGTGNPLTDPTSALVFPRNMNRISGPDSNSCFGCHNAPVSGGGGDFVTGVFVLGQRFDFTTFDHADPTPTRGAANEVGAFVKQDDVANFRATLGMFGSGYIEMLCRQMTTDLQAQRDGCPPGASAALVTKGVSFGTLTHNTDSTWDCTQVTGLPAPSTATTGTTPPNLIIRPFHQAGAVISLRQFSNNAFNHHHGIQAVERFGSGDPDNDGFTDEMTIADVTAVSVYQATLAVPGRVIPRNPTIEAAVHLGENRFAAIGCATCHVPSLPLDGRGWIYTEPNPFNPTGNLRPGDPYVAAHGTYEVDLNSADLPGPRLRERRGVVDVPAFTDLKLHDITSGPNDPNREALDMQAPAGSPAFFAGNAKFVTKKLWGCANEPPFFHHGKFATMREAVEAHAGEAAAVMAQYHALGAAEQDAIIEFLKTLQVLPAGTKSLIVDENYESRDWQTAFQTAR